MSRRNSSFCNSPTTRALTSNIPRARFATTRFVILNPLAVTLRNRAVAALASARNSFAVFRVLFGARDAALDRSSNRASSTNRISDAPCSRTILARVCPPSSLGTMSTTLVVVAARLVAASPRAAVSTPIAHHGRRRDVPTTSEPPDATNASPPSTAPSSRALPHDVDASSPSRAFKSSSHSRVIIIHAFASSSHPSSSSTATSSSRTITSTDPRDARVGASVDARAIARCESAPVCRMEWNERRRAEMSHSHTRTMSHPQYIRLSGANVIILDRAFRVAFSVPRTDASRA